MKQTKHNKPKTFRTLIRRKHISRKTVMDSNQPAARRKNEKLETYPPFFFGS